MKIQICILLFLISGGFLFSQELNFSQFYHHKPLINPAYTGLSKSMNIYGMHRNQWYGIGESNLFNTTAVAMDYGKAPRSSHKYGSGLGVGFMYKNSLAGLSRYQTDQIKFSIASDAPRIGNEKRAMMFQFPFGLSIGYVHQRFKTDNLIFTDQLDPVLGNVLSGAGIPSSILDHPRYHYVEVGFGGMAGVRITRNRNRPTFISLGFSITKYLPIVDRKELSYFLENKWSVHGFFHKPIKKYTVSAGLIYQNHAHIHNFLVGGEFITPLGLSFGGWMRHQRFDMNTINFTDLIFNVAYRYKSYLVGYSYDVTVSRLSNSSTYGTHELCLKIEVFKDSKRIEKKRKKHKSCFYTGM